MASNVVINRSPTTEEAQDAVGAALQAPLVYDDASNTISVNDGGVTSQFIAPTYTTFTSVDQTLTNTAEVTLGTISLPTVSYASTVVWTIGRVFLTFNAGFVQYDNCNVLFHDGTTIADSVVGGLTQTKIGTTAISSRFEAGTYQFVVQYAANTARDITIGHASDDDGSRRVRLIGISTMEYHQ